MFTKNTWNFLFISLLLFSVNVMANKDVTEKADLFTENCGEYQSDTTSFRSSSDLLSSIISGSVENNPLRKVENCLLQAIDKSLRPICEEEKILKQELRESNYSFKDLKEINRLLMQLVKVKWEYADTLYEFANEADKMVKELHDDATTNTTTNSSTDTIIDSTTNYKTVYNRLLTIPLRTYKDIVAIRARRLCGSTLKRNAEEGVLVRNLDSN